MNAGACLNILEFMAVDAGYDAANTYTITAASKVKALHIPTEKLQQVGAAHSLFSTMVLFAFPALGVESELQAYTYAAFATPAPGS